MNRDKKLWLYRIVINNPEVTGISIGLGIIITVIWLLLTWVHNIYDGFTVDNKTRFCSYRERIDGEYSNTAWSVKNPSSGIVEHFIYTEGGDKAVQLKYEGKTLLAKPLKKTRGENITLMVQNLAGDYSDIDFAHIVLNYDDKDNSFEVIMKNSNCVHIHATPNNPR